MDYEIEFHPVGDASRAGDAISIRYGVNGAYEIMVVDGGTDDAGSELVEHIKSFYGSDTVISHVVNTHPDTDHACGLREILRNFQVKNLWLHGVWHHADEMLPYFADKRWTGEGLATAIRDRYPVVKELIELAEEQGTNIYEPFQGVAIGPFAVLSPSRWTYLRLVPQFRKTPDHDPEALTADNMLLGRVEKSGLLGQIVQKATAAIRAWVDENWDIELLRERSITAAENETSTVLYGRFGDKSVLLTGDAGVNALTWACNQADARGFDLSTLAMVQVPHHGSRSNVTPSILDRLLGPKLPRGSAKRRSAFVSVPKDDENHPRKMVMNAFHRRGAPVYKTQGVYIRHYSGMPARRGESAAIPFDWFDKVEEYD